MTKQIPPPFAGYLVSQLKKYLFSWREAGVWCPGCGRWVKVQARTLGLLHAKCLRWLDRWAQEHGDEFVHKNKMPSEIIKDGGEFCRLRFWGLIETRPCEEDEDKRRSGYWRITKAGVDFLHDRSRVPSHAFFRSQGGNPIIEDWAETTIGIRDTLKRKKFSYSDLMDNYGL